MRVYLINDNDFISETNTPRKIYVKASSGSIYKNIDNTEV